MEELLAIEAAPEASIADAEEAAELLAVWERGSVAMAEGDRILAVRWSYRLVAIVFAGSPEFVEQQLQDQLTGFGDSITAWHRTWDRAAACVILRWALTRDAVRVLDCELKQAAAEGGGCPFSGSGDQERS